MASFSMVSLSLESGVTSAFCITLVVGWLGLEIFWFRSRVIFFVESRKKFNVGSSKGASFSMRASIFSVAE